MRGKERCSAEALRGYLADEQSTVSRIELRLYPDLTNNGMDAKTISDRVKPIRYKVVHKNNFMNEAPSLMTKEGVRLWPLKTLYPDHAGFNLRSERLAELLTLKLTLNRNGNGYLTVWRGAETVTYGIPRFSIRELREG